VEQAKKQLTHDDRARAADEATDDAQEEGMALRTSGAEHLCSGGWFHASSIEIRCRTPSVDSALMSALVHTMSVRLARGADWRSRAPRLAGVSPAVWRRLFWQRMARLQEGRHAVAEQPAEGYNDEPF
jgi:hypothetical protein